MTLKFIFIAFCTRLIFINTFSLELELKLERRAEKEQRKLEDLTILTPRSRHFPAMQYDVSKDYLESEEIEEEKSSFPRFEQDIKKLTKDGETYVHGFDFLQRIQHWMWNLGLFNKE